MFGVLISIDYNNIMCDNTATITKNQSHQDELHLIMAEATIRNIKHVSS
jgi:hypothetical protein